ncbi:DUF6455 family protein [Pseudodonghicola xiamenensis]|uniref:DUF6455 domain-containing protein n=1 Tax=Pseudodonghicola xiamenensis TaxID=337702 RepID=A0A8J3HC33_9RHOB|nr:DUF6455 family protein [Pseudodonghicola xiamenensis]GHH01639.1 hypothetical protein GCM10010961_39030 [Pseudodonghicola xiamenensis]
MTSVLGNVMTHVRLVSRMARATGTDLVGAYRAGDLTQEAWVDMVQACRGCSWAGACGDWLEAHEYADRAPTECPNRGRFLDLQALAALRMPEEA